MNTAGSEWIFFALGAAFIMFGIYSRVRLRRLSQSEYTVPGTIVDYEELSDLGVERGSTGIKYYPVIRFDTPKGRVQEVSRIGTSGRAEEIGANVQVHYDPEDPARFELLNGKETLKRQSIPIALGVAFLAVGTALLL